MPDYAYKAVNSSGAATKGVLFAGSPSDLAGRLKAEGLYLLRHREAKAGGLERLLAGLKDIQIGGVSRKELIEFSNNMGVMVKAGVPVIDALEELSQDLDNAYFKRVLKNIVRDVQQGKPLHESMAERGKFFSKMYVNVIQVAENTGKLEEAFFDLSKHFERIDEIVKNVRKAMIYPMFVLSVLFGAAYLFLTYVFPAVFEMLTGFNVPLPTITKVVMAVSAFFQDHAALILLGFFCLIVFVVLLRRFEKTRYVFDWCELNLPYLKGFFTRLHMAFFARYLSVMQSAGVDILKSLEFSAQTVKNQLIRKVLTQCQKRVTEGELISESMRGVPFIPRMVTRMIAVGEVSGSLPEQMEYVADHYNKELQDRIDLALSLLEPIILLILAAFVMVMVLAVILPIYDMVNQITSQMGDAVR